MPRRTLAIATMVTAAIALGSVGFLFWKQAKDEAAKVAAPVRMRVPRQGPDAGPDAARADAATVVAKAPDAGGVDALAKTPDAGAQDGAIVLADAAQADAAKPDAAPVLDAAVATTTPTHAATSSAMPAHVSASLDVATTAASTGQFIIESVPSAVVYVDGTNKGKTPVTLPSANDTFTISLFAEGFALYTGKLSGTGKHVVKLQKAERFAGVGGIKVRCNETKRYYVLVDGRQTGQLCPTERLGVPLGVHQVEIVDLIGDAYRTLSVDADNADKSIRVNID